MLVPLVLRNIVFPYLRSTPAAATAAVAATQAFSTSSTSRRAAEAVALAGEQLDEPFRQARPWSTTSQALRHDRLLDHDPPRLRRGTINPVKQEEVPVRLPRADERKSVEPIPQRLEPQLAAAEEVPKTSVFDRSRPPPTVDVPPGVAQLLEARLYRMAVFQVLGSPELVSDPALVDHVARRLEKNGAGKLARRLRRSVEIAADTAPGDKVRLWSEPRAADAARRPPDFWRVDRTIPRHDGAYPGNTPAERRTHHFNQQLTRLLTLRHALPYELHLGPDPRAPPPKLRRVRDLLAYIDRLRAHHSFVPDRVTANIVVKAWLVNLARGTQGHGDAARAKLGRDGLEKAELRGVFEFVSASMLAEVERPGEKLTSGDDGALPFDSSLDFDRHVRPFAKSMLRAMRRIGDREGREVVTKWVERMEGELGRKEGALSGKEETPHKGE